MRILAALLCVGLAACAHVDVARETAVRLQFDDGSCSGTIVGPHAVLSATHCFADGGSVAIWRQPVAIRERLDDGHDHTIIVVDRTFPAWAIVGRMPPVGAEIHILGNPGDLVSAYRHGYVSGMQYIDRKLSDLYDIRGWFGDSGAGIFDQDGKLVAVISFVDTLDDPRAQMTMMGSFPLAFTAAQWAEVAQ